uniref:Uncharacterized protein n=1 Tax=Globisporangium ultimum (strain ATCC 200006 / CBS 805.95 / DAOM BR144) TaxID=431595 RepID=K3WN93_GLOUD
SWQYITSSEDVVINTSLYCDTAAGNPHHGKRGVALRPGREIIGEVTIAGEDVKQLAVGNRV